MERRRLKSNSKTRRLRPRTAGQKLAAAKEARTNRAAKKVANKSYYRKNKTQILKRAKQRRERAGRGDTRVTRTRLNVHTK